ncbi:MAG: hypothetical protein ACPGR2_00620 [Psychrobium sp.]
MKKLALIITTCLLTGCYSNWPSLDKANKAIKCDMDVAALSKLAKRYQAQGAFDEISNSFAITKHDDAIAVAFNHKAQIMTIASTKSEITLGGLMRRQGDVVIVKRCIKQ